VCSIEKMLRDLAFASYERLVDYNFFAVTSVNSQCRQSSNCFRMSSKERCIRSTPTETQSMRENDFECLAITGVNAPPSPKVLDEGRTGSWDRNRPLRQTEQPRRTRHHGTTDIPSVADVLMYWRERAQ
jgi:hypothetical protein